MPHSERRKRPNGREGFFRVLAEVIARDKVFLAESITRCEAYFDGSIMRCGRVVPT